MADTAVNPKGCILSLAWYVHQYKVLAVTNTTAFKPGQWLQVADVEKLCERPDFEVRVIDNDVLDHVMGLLGGASMLARV